MWAEAGRRGGWGGEEITPPGTKRQSSFGRHAALQPFSGAAPSPFPPSTLSGVTSCLVLGTTFSLANHTSAVSSPPQWGPSPSAKPRTRRGSRQWRKLQDKSTSPVSCQSSQLTNPPHPPPHSKEILDNLLSFVVTCSFPLSHLGTSPKRGAAEITRGLRGESEPLRREKKIRAVLEEGKADATRTRRRLALRTRQAGATRARERGGGNTSRTLTVISPAVNHNTSRFSC